MYKYFSIKWLPLSSVTRLNDENLTNDITYIGEKNYVRLFKEFVNIAACAHTTPHTPRHGTFIVNKIEIWSYMWF